MRGGILTVLLGEGFLKMCTTRYSLAITAPNASMTPSVTVQVCTCMGIENHTTEGKQGREWGIVGMKGVESVWGIMGESGDERGRVRDNGGYWGVSVGESGGRVWGVAQ